MVKNAIYKHNYCFFLFLEIFLFLESYERALYYEDKALFVSDLTTETEGTEETTKRKKKKRKKSDYFSSSDEETNLPPFPKLKKKASDLNENQPKSFVAEPFYIIPEAQAVTPSQSASSSHFFTPTDMLQHHAQNASSFNIQTISTYPASTSSDLLNQSFVQGASPLTSVENKNTKEESESVVHSSLLHFIYTILYI